MGVLIDRNIVKFCAIECRLQQSGELSVHWMVDAWLYALKTSNNEWAGVVTADYRIDYKLPDLQDVINIGRLIEPNVNVRTDRSEFRTVDVRVGWDVKAPWEDVPRLMVALMEQRDELTPEEFFKAYEDIHPWRDGNGRSGVLLYNWIKGTLDNPVWAPNFWNDPRRTIGYGA